MSGPNYPRIDPNSNEIGNFTIGTSQIGTIPLFDVWDTIISQYANSDILTKLITNFSGYIDQTANLDAFFDLIWNVDTAQGYGLDVWGRIVGVSRIIEIPNSNSYLGFEEMGPPDALPFGQAAFYNGTPLTSSFALTDTAYRRLILAKAMFNITDGSIPSINRILLSLFPGRGNCYVTEGTSPPGYFGFFEQTNALTFNQGVFYDGQTFPRMQMTYTFEFPLTPVEIAIVQQSGVLPKPTGVLASVIQKF